MRMLVESLNPSDRIAIVAYAGSSGLVLDSTPVTNSARILQAVESLRPGGSTHGSAGIQLAYEIANHNHIAGGTSRVILCTDGDFNVGIADQDQLVRLVEQKAKSDIYLTILGFGKGNLQDGKMELMTNHGNGNYAYVDSTLEAHKVLVDGIGGMLIPIAKDVKIQLDFNPRLVHSYRLIGYENRVMPNQDFRNDAKDAGEIGSGHCVTAFYEIVPSSLSNSLKQLTGVRQSEFVSSKLSDKASSDDLLTVNLRYKKPDTQRAEEFQHRVSSDTLTQEAKGEFGFAAAVAGYGLLLRESVYSGQLDWNWVIETAQTNLGSDPRGLRADFVQLAGKAKRLQATRK